MSRLAQAVAGLKRVQLHVLRLAGPLAATAALSACSSGMSLDKIEADRSIVTGSVASGPQAPADSAVESDRLTIRNAVSSASLDDLGGRPIPWANSDTGSRGAVTDVAEYREKGVLCRKFTATRESFDGVALYGGHVCLGEAGIWWVRSFDRV